MLLVVNHVKMTEPIGLIVCIEMVNISEYSIDKVDTAYKT